MVGGLTRGDFKALQGTGLRVQGCRSRGIATFSPALDTLSRYVTVVSPRRVTATNSPVFKSDSYLIDSLALALRLCGRLDFWWSLWLCHLRDSLFLLSLLHRPLWRASL